MVSAKAMQSGAGSQTSSPAIRAMAEDSTPLPRLMAIRRFIRQAVYCASASGSPTAGSRWKSRPISAARV